MSLYLNKFAIEVELILRYKLCNNVPLTMALQQEHLVLMVPGQCDQIWRFIGLGATFKSFWQQLICPNLSHSKGIFVKESKSIIFLVKSILGKFYRYFAIFSGHTVPGVYLPICPATKSSISL